MRFTFAVWRTLRIQLGIKLRMWTAYHPQSDKQVEKVNATLETFLKVYIAQLLILGYWTQLFQLVEFNYNTVRNNVL